MVHYHNSPQTNWLSIQCIGTACTVPPVGGFWMGGGQSYQQPFGIIRIGDGEFVPDFGHSLRESLPRWSLVSGTKSYFAWGYLKDASD